MEKMRTNILYKAFKIVGVIGLLVTASCSDILEEEPRATLTPEFFQTPEGINGGLTAVYSSMRYLYGPIGGLYVGTVGTDECTWGAAVDGGGKECDIYGTSLTDNNGATQTIWLRTFIYINTCNGIIEVGTANGMAPSLIAEAKFFRAHDYFLLVNNYGEVPLDLGAGPLAFNSTPTRTSVKNTIPEVYEAIFQDLEEAVTELPDNPRLTGAVTKTAARLFLAKAYLTYGWWCEKNSVTPAENYFQLAYDIAIDAIENPGPFGLMNTFYDVNLAANDRNKEWVLYADHNDNYLFSESSNQNYDWNGDQVNEGGMKENRSNYAITCNFEQSTGGVAANVIRRIAEQKLGRPWTRIAPTTGALLNTFADKTHDSRYDGTFVTTYYANFRLEPGDANVVSKTGANGLPIAQGDTAWKFLDDDTEMPNLVNVGDGYSLPGRAYAVWTPSTINRTRFPGVWKFGPDRSNKTRSGPFNAVSTRPFPIAKFSELYLLAAEAAVKGATEQAGYSARELVNVLRARAGKWRYINNKNLTVSLDYSADMTAATPATITIDYILAERSREFFAEGWRWYDLTRTGKLEEYAGTYYICESSPMQNVATAHTRTITPDHYLRPIPYQQLDRMFGTEEEKNEYQNPGYRH
jgi:hypothetical protein